MSTPYCTADGCHDTRTNTYAISGTSGSGNIPPPNGVTAWFGVWPWGVALCRIHALQRFRFSIGGTR